MTAADEGDDGAAAMPAQVRASAEVLFGDRLAMAVEYAWLLTTDGVLRGLIGPREAPRIWERHLLNCAVVAERIPAGVSVVDVGSGAGLPGLVLAIARPDLSVTLVDSMARRTAFLTEAVGVLGLTEQTRVVRARAEECAGRVAPAEVVTARALAPLDKLAQWCLPLTTTGGRVLAIKGDSAAEEVATHAAAIRRLGGGTPAIHECGAALLDTPTTVVEIVRQQAAPVQPTDRRSPTRRRR